MVSLNDLDLLDVKIIHLYAAEWNGVGSGGAREHVMPIEQGKQCMIITEILWSISYPEDTPGAGGFEAVYCGLGTPEDPRGTGVADYSCPQAIAHKHLLIYNRGGLAVTYRPSEPKHSPMTPIPYPFKKMVCNVKSTNSSSSAWVHVRLMAYVVDISPLQFKAITTKLGQKYWYTG